MKKRWLGLVWPLCLSACTSMPPQAVPLCASAAAAEPEPWWRGFDDPALLGLLDEARRCNVRLAQLRLQADRWRLQLDMPDWHPSGGLAVDVSRPLDGGAAQRNHAVDLRVKYELDLWGRVARGKEAEAWLARAGELDWRALRLSTSAEVAIRYWQWSALWREALLAEQAVMLQISLLRLHEQAQAQGALADREVRRTRLALNDAYEWLSTLTRERDWAANRLAELLERDTIDDLPWPVALPERVPELASELAAEGLMRRPDIAAAAARVARLLALYDQARLNPLPRIGLSGRLGAANSMLTELWGGTLAVGAIGLELPFLDWRRLGVAREQARLEWEAETLAYRHTVKQALRETDDALRRHRQAREDLRRTDDSLDLARRSEHDAQLAYATGVSGREPWLQAQIARLQLETARVRQLQARASSLVLLYKALGGVPVDEAG
ncbi:TolC family protein [Paludibacterium purpuratum]|uniref:Outer membrane protein TolC n=1 Tax=Paludibacterium purpuratum TaxID=1144873 RepID=A0A4V3DV05_9NEIS|nr:TolC family protein [Paludibacterium purpuratum]TDR78337.1 outer membrane protein TolC [Paludibacterium purpuratum]